jgi:hypothetical protein
LVLLSGILVVQTPADSPDLNPIEDLWQPLRDKMRQQAAVTEEQLPGLLRRVWEKELREAGILAVQEYCTRLERIRQQGYRVQPVSKKLRQRSRVDKA